MYAGNNPNDTSYYIQFGVNETSQAVSFRPFILPLSHIERIFANAIATVYIHFQERSG